MDKYLIREEAPRVPPYDAAGVSYKLTTQVAHFLFPLLVELDVLVGKRLIRTFVQIIMVILTFRDRANGLLLSELGRYLLSPEHAPAGTKRLSNEGNVVINLKHTIRATYIHSERRAQRMSTRTNCVLYSPY